MGAAGLRYKPFQQYRASLIRILGNSGSGKSTLASRLARSKRLPHLDLDTLAWHPGEPPRRRPVVESAREVTAFMAANVRWVIEGCYADLLETALPRCTRLLFLNPGIDDLQHETRRATASSSGNRRSGCTFPRPLPSSNL